MFELPEWTTLKIACEEQPSASLIFYHIVVSITVQNHDNLESLCVTEKKATFVFGCKEDYVKREIVLTPSTSNKK